MNSKTETKSESKVKDRVDRTDRKIIALLEINPKLTQNEIAHELGMSQSAIALRMYKLKQSSLLIEESGINYEVLGMLMCRVDVETTSQKSVLAWASKCPLFINGSRSVGDYGLSLFFTAEDNEMFHYLVDEHIRRLSGVEGVKFSLIHGWERPFMLQLDLDYSSKENPPCGEAPFCPKCPSNPKYNGRIWNHIRLKELIRKA